MKDKNVQNLCETDRAFSVISAYAVKERALSSPGAGVYQDTNQAGLSISKYR